MVSRLVTGGVHVRTRRRLGRAATAADLDRRRRRRRAATRDAGRRPLRPALVVAGRLGIACNWSPGGFDRPRHDRIAVLDVATGERRVLAEKLDRPVGAVPRQSASRSGTGSSILFAVKELELPPADACRPSVETVEWAETATSGERLDLSGGIVVHAASTPRCRTNLRRRQPTEQDQQGVRRASACQPSERFVATSPDGEEVEAWLVRPTTSRRASTTRCCSTSTAAPLRSTGTSTSTSSRPTRGLRRRLLEPARVLRLFGSLGSGHSRPCGRRPRLGFARLRRPDGSRGHGPPAVRLHRPRPTGSDGWLVRRLHDDLDREPHGPLQGRMLGAGRQQHAREFGSADFGWFHRAYTGVWPFEDVEPYLAQSPTTYADKITTPLLILHSENDLRCPISRQSTCLRSSACSAARWSSCASPAESHDSPAQDLRSTA